MLYRFIKYVDMSNWIKHEAWRSKLCQKLIWYYGNTGLKFEFWIANCVSERSLQLITIGCMYKEVILNKRDSSHRFDCEWGFDWSDDHQWRQALQTRLQTHDIIRIQQKLKCLQKSFDLKFRFFPHKYDSKCQDFSLEKKLFSEGTFLWQLYYSWEIGRLHELWHEIREILIFSLGV